MTDPYRTPAEIAADIPRRPFDWSYWQPFVMGMKAMGLLMFAGLKIVEGCETHVPPMHDVPSGYVRVPSGNGFPHVETAATHHIAAFAPPCIISSPPTSYTIEPSDRVNFNYPGEVLTFTCDGKPGKTTCDGPASVTHKSKTAPTPVREPAHGASSW